MNKTEEFSNKFGAKYGFDPTVIIGIIQAIMAIFANCPKPPAAIRGDVKSPGPWQRARAIRIVKQELGRMSRRRAEQIADDLMSAATAEDDATVEASVAECCDPSRW